MKRTIWREKFWHRRENMVKNNIIIKDKTDLIKEITTKRTRSKRIIKDLVRQENEIIKG